MTFGASSGNVFADLALENADELLVKADVAHAINSEVLARGWTQVEAAQCTGLTVPDISRIGRMMTDAFSTEGLQNALRRVLATPPTTGALRIIRDTT